MVSKEDGRLTPEGKGKVPEGSQESGEKKGSPEEKKESPEGNGKKKFKAEAFPLGTPEGEEQTPEGEAKKGDIPSGDEAGPSGHKSAPSGEEGKDKDPSQFLKEEKTPSGESKEVMMDEELTKKFDEVIGKIDEVTKSVPGEVEKALEKRQPKPSGTSESHGKEEAKPLTRADVVGIVKDHRQQEEQERRRQQQAKTEETKLEKIGETVKDLAAWKEKCEKEGDPVACRRVAELEKKLPGEKPKTEEGAEVKSPFERVEEMTPEKRKAYTEEQNRQRDEKIRKGMKLMGMSDNDAYRVMSEESKDVIAQKPDMKERMLKNLSPTELIKLCNLGDKDACKVAEERGYRIIKKEELDKEIGKKVEEELEKRPRI